ncbi:hypothetical protein L3Q82_004228 [Scortum barcoo]|uniref:Uncharacterized protein n=1 Tax=Scortum barcoo TaxID=214431 RepID=A0ACB8VJS6_9TELE|nr:hypothetical protein L3Q82_004228 [Scortum barcoo]
MEAEDGADLCYPQLLNTSCRKPTSLWSEALLIQIVLSSISLLTVALNLLIIISVSHFRQLHTPTNILLLSLAVSDFLVGLLLIPVLTLKRTSCWFFGELVCSLYTYVSFIITSASIGDMIPLLIPCLIEHDIDVGDAQPIRQHFYHMSPDRRKYLEAERIRALFERLAEARLTINLAKCEFARATVTYLGRVVGQGRVALVQDKVPGLLRMGGIPLLIPCLIEHDIDVGDAQPIRQHFYHMSPDRRKYLEAEIRSVWSKPCYIPEVQQQPVITKTVQSQEAEQTLQGCFEATDWDVLCDVHGEDIEKLTDYITDYVNFCTDNIILTKTVRCFPNNKPWVTKDMLNRKKASIQEGRQRGAEEGAK